MSESPASSTSRPRAKPLRTYGKRSIRDDSPREQSLKKRRIPSEETPTDTSAPKDAGKESPSLPKIVAEDTQNTTETTAPNKPTKGSILSFFKPIPSSSTAASSPKSDEPRPGSTPPSSPPAPRIEARKKPRLLRIRATSLPALDGENSEDDTQPAEGAKDEEESGAKPARSAFRESSLNRESSSNSDAKAGKKTKGKSTVQTTLNLSSQAAFSECKVCNTVWNPLYPDDVKYHAKQHAAVLRARRKEKENEL